MQEGEGAGSRSKDLRWWKSAILAFILGASAIPAGAATATRSIFGKLPDGRDVAAVTLHNHAGVSATVVAYGATLQSVILPDRKGVPAEVTLGHRTLEPYLANPQYFGATVGLFANRIANGRFTLDGKVFQVPRNNGPNSLHGGTVGFDKVLWTVTGVQAGADKSSVSLCYVSPDGDQGYPGTLTVTAIYSLDEKNRLKIDYRASTDRPTVVNVTNHTYWNLAGEGSAHGALEEILTIPAGRFLPVDRTLIPTGERRKVDGTVFDFRSPRVISSSVRDARDPQIAFGRGYDHNWVLDHPGSSGLHLTARLADPVSGRRFEIWSNQPGIQFYSGNFLDGTTVGRTDRLYRQGDAVALEPQTFPDAVNRPDFPSARLDPGATYRNLIEYRFFMGRGPP
jgi:aldose 1-epimerase